MKKTSNWHDMVMQVQQANLEKQVIQSKVRQLRKLKYKLELDKQMEQRKRNIINQNVLKKKQRQEIQQLAAIEANFKKQEKKQKQIKEQNYNYQNLKLMKQNQSSIISQTKNHDQSFKQHPFVRLVDFQDKRKQQLKRKFVKQNQINQLQEKIKYKNRATLRFQQKKQLEDLLKFEEDVYKNRQAERNKFKNKYLKIKKSENIFQDDLNPEKSNPTSVEKEYVDYLNKQMIYKNKKQIQQKYMIDDKIKSLHGDDSFPDSSPAYLGRNVLSNDRKRQIHYLDKCLGINQRSYTQQKCDFKKTVEILDNDLINLSNFSAKQVERYQTSSPDVNKTNNGFILGNLNKQNTNLYNKSHQISPTQRLSRNFREQKIKQSISVPKIQLSNNKNQQHIIEKQTKKQSFVQDDSRRIKSQLAQVKIKTQSGSKNVQLKPVKRRQFRQYDVITGKSNFFFV